MDSMASHSSRLDRCLNWPNSELFSVVSLDGRNQAPSWGNYTSNFPQATLFLATQLGAGPHTLQVTNYPVSGTQAALSIDYAMVWGTPAETSHKKKSSTPVGAIAGGVIGGVLLLAFLIGLFLFLRRRSRKSPARDVLSDPDEMSEGIDTSHVSPYKEQGPYYTHHLGSQSNVHSAPQSTIDYSGTFGQGNGHSDTSTNTTSALFVQNHPGDRDAQQTSYYSSPSSGAGSVVSPISTDPSAYLAADRQRAGKSARPGIVPPTQRTDAQFQMAQRSPEELRQERMVVEGRPQDFGPVVPVVGEEGNNVDLPPDYRQAVQPPARR